MDAKTTRDGGFSHPSERERGRRGGGRTSAIVAVAAVATVGTLFALADWIGGDLAGSMLRAEMFRQGHYWRIPAWFGGIPNVTYSFLVPPLGAAIGVRALLVVSAVVAVAGLHRLLGPIAFDRRWVALGSFALALIANLANGRAPFLLGTAFATWSLVGLAGAQRREPRAEPAGAGPIGLTLAGALGTGLSSPVAGVFLALCAAGVLLRPVSARRWVLLGAIGALGVGPSLVANLVFHTGGGLDVPWTTAAWVGALFAALALFTRSRPVRIAALLGIAVAVAVGALKTPLAYIIKRLPETAGGPSAAATVNRAVAAVLIAVLGGWNLLTIRTSIAQRGPERSGAVYQPLLAELRRVRPTGLVEVSPTRLHWETYYVAREFPIARGWERQADIDHGPLFYTGRPITAQDYRDWLTAMNVEYVVLGTMRSDEKAGEEAALLRTGLPYLTEVWRDAVWTMWRVERGQLAT